jgi:hypothetical protein
VTALNSAAFDLWKAKARAVPIENELARRGVKLRGKVERDGPCPKCGGDDRFSINTTKQVFNCRGCQTGGDVIALVQHLDGVDFNGACTTLTGEPPPNGKDKDAPKPVEIRTANYGYRDESGTALFAVARYEYQNPDGSFVLKNGRRSKTFKQRRPDPASPGNSIPNVEGVRIIPYRLPGLIEAIGNDHTILIVEGEAKVDLLWSWNVPATCNAMGAGKWRSEHSEFLRGADVVVLPDNDEPGCAHADAVAASLQEIAKSVRILELPGLEPKQDIVDWAKQGGTVEQLHDLIAREARPWTPRPTKPDQPDQQSDATTALESSAASAFKLAGLTWLWPNRFALGKLGLLAGLPDRGKGLITTDITSRVTTGELWPCNEGRALKGRVLMLSAEDDIEDTIVPRLKAAGADLDMVEIARMVRRGDDKRMFSLVTDLELLRSKVDALGDVVMIVIDPMSAYLGVGKIDSFRTTDVRGVLAPLTEFAAEKRLFVLGVLHFNKKTDVTNAMLRISDSLAFAATARHCYVVVDDPENERKLFLKAKNNLAPDTKALSYGINATVVGQDEQTGKDIWAPRVVWGTEHVEVTATEAMQAEAAGRSSASNAGEIAKKFLTEQLSGGPVAKSEINEAADANGISDITLRRAKAELGVIAKKGGFAGGWAWELPAQPQRGKWNDD